MSESREHHTVSKFLLKRFARNKRVAAVNRHTLATSERKIKEATVERDFYTVDLKTGDKSLFVEKGLAALENIVAPALDKLASTGDEPTFEERIAISLFMAIQLLRGQDAREMTRQTRKLACEAAIEMMPLEAAAQMLRKNDPNVSDAEVEAQWRHWKEDTIVDVPSDPNFQARMILEQAPEFAELLCALKDWQLWKFPTATLLTGDRPIATWRHSSNPAPIVGILNADEIHFPLNPHVALVLYQPGAGECTRDNVDVQYAQRINENVAFQCLDWIFHHPRHSPLKGIKLKPRPPLVVRKGGLITGLSHVSPDLDIEALLAAAEQRAKRRVG